MTQEGRHKRMVFERELDILRKVSTDNSGQYALPMHFLRDLVAEIDRLRAAALAMRDRCARVADAEAAAADQSSKGYAQSVRESGGTPGEKDIDRAFALGQAERALAAKRIAEKIRTLEP